MSASAVLSGPPFAHRGLWRGGGAPENSLAAFRAACLAGYGVELDVRLSADGEAVVFHDDCLDRLTAEAGLVEECPAETLCALSLLGSDQTIPTLAQALEAIGGRAPLLVELKTPDGQEGLLEARVGDLLSAYDGPAGVLSFNVAALAWLARRRPALQRGLNLNSEASFASAGQAAPDFLSVSLDLAGHAHAQRWRAGGKPVVAWTARRPTDAARVKQLVDNFMFEGFEP